MSDGATATTSVVAFDVYGTLGHWPADRVHPIDVQRLLQRFGIDISYQAFEAARQTVLFLDTLKRPIHGWLDYLALLFHHLGVQLSTDLLESIAAMYEAKAGFELFDDAAQAISDARAMGIRTCAFTTLPRFMLGASAAPVLNMLDAYFDAAAIGFAKGDLRFYRSIAERLGVKANEILAVGDDPLCDVELPRAAGWRAVLLCRDPTAGAADHRDSPFIRSLTELQLFHGNAS